jgi:hypothetical protein
MSDATAPVPVTGGSREERVFPTLTYAHATGHPVIASAEPGERWLYCYPDDAFAEY